MDPAAEFTRVFGDAGASDAALEAKLQELCTYLLAFEERGEVFGRRNDRRIMECLAKLLSAYVDPPVEPTRPGKEKKGAATEPAAAGAPPPAAAGGGAGGAATPRRGRSARGGAAGASASASPTEGAATRAAPSLPLREAAPTPPRKRGVNVMELVCRALWTYEEVTELHSEEGYGPMLAEAPMRALLSVLEPTPAAWTLAAARPEAPATEKPKGKDKWKGKAKAKEPEVEVPFELPPPQSLDPDRRLAAEESVKLMMLLGQVRRGGATASRRDMLIRRVFPGTGGLEARRIIIRLGGLAVLGEYTRACYKDGRTANALDALTLMQGLCQVSREQPGEALAPTLVSLLRDDSAAALHHECLRCLASVYAACGEREGAVLALVDLGLPALLAKMLGRGVTHTEEPAGGSGRGDESGGDASTSATSASIPVMDTASRLVLWFFSPNTPRVAHLCFKEGVLDLLSDVEVLTRACAMDGSGATTSAVTLLLQTTEKALAHLFAPDVSADGATKKDVAKSAAVAALEASHHGLQIGDRVRDIHHDTIGEIISLMSGPGGRCLVAWDERTDESDEDDEEEDEEDEEEDDMDHDGDIDELPGHGDVPSAYLELVDDDGERGPVGHAAALAGPGGATLSGDPIGFRGGPESGGGAFVAALPGSREFWIGAGTSASAAPATSGDPVRAAREATAVESAELVPLARRLEMARVFTARLLPALLAAQRTAAHEPTKRLVLRLVLSLLSHVGDSRLPGDDFASLLSLLGTTLSDAQSSGLLILALQVADSLIRLDAVNARELRRHGLLRRIERLASKGGADGGKGDRTSPRRRTPSSLGAALQAATGAPPVSGGITGAAREQEQVYAMARQTLDNAQAAFKTVQDGAPGTSGVVAADRLASTAAAVASGDASAVRRLASMLVSADGVTVYEMEEARLATALVHYLVGDGAATEPSTLATRRDAFRIAFLEPATPPRTDESRRGEREDKANAAIDGSSERTAFAVLLRLLHSTLELNEQLPVFRNLALGHQPPADANRPGGPLGAVTGVDASAKLASGLNMLAAPLRLTLRRSPLATRGVTDLAGAPLHAGPLTPSAAVEHHILRRVVILDPGYRRWCDALVGGRIWLWIPGTVNREDVDAVEDGEEPLAATSPRGRRRRGGTAAASPAEAEKAGRWAAADVKRYNPTTGRHALIVEGGAGFRLEPAARPALQHVALVERKYRVIHRPEPKPAPEPEKPRPGKDKKKRSKPDAKADKADESSRKRRRKAKSPVKAIRPEDASTDTFRVILLQPESDWDVDTFVENHLDQLWNILEEEASKFAPAAPAGAAAPPAETPEDAAAREITAAVASRLDRALGLSPSQIRSRHRRVNADGDVDDGEVETDDEGIVELHEEDIGARGALGWNSFAHYEEEVMDALEKDMAVPVVKKASREVCDAIAAAVTEHSASLTPAVRLNPRANAGVSARETHACRPPLGSRVVIEPRAAEEARQRARIAMQGLPAPPPPPRVPRGAGESRPDPDDTWLAGTVVRHRAADSVDVELDTDGALVENVRLENLRMSDEEEDRTAAALLPVATAGASSGGGTAGGGTAGGGTAGGFRVGDDGEIQLDVHLGSSREQVHSAVGEMLRGGVSRDEILEALLRASGVSSGPGGSITLRRLPGTDNDVGVFSVVSSRSPIPPGVGGGLARSWSGLDISEAGRDGTRIMRSDISLDQLRRRGDEEAIARAPSQPPSRPASRGPPRAPFRPPSRLGGPSSLSPEKASAPAAPPPPRRCEKPPVVRVRFALATPDDSGATAASLFAAEPPGVPNGSATRVPTLSAPPFPGSTAGIYAARARAAAGSPPTTLRAAPGSATLFHTLRSLAAAAATAARNAGGVNGEDTAADVVSGSTDHDRWFARSVLHYDVRVEGLPAGMASTAEEISSATPEPPPPLPAPRPPPPPRAKSERQDLWPVRDVRDRLLGGKSPKLTKTTVISRLRAVCGAEALARRDLRGATVSAAKRVSASKLADLYAELHDELTRRRKEPGRIDEDDVEGNGDGDGDGKVETPTVPNPSPPAEGARVEEDAWALYWELLRAGVGGEGRGPPEPAPIRALAPSAASGDIDERPPPGSSLIASSCIARGGGRDPTAAAAAVALLSALHRRFGPVGGSTAWENSRVAQKLQAQLEDAVAVASGAVPAWTHTLLRGAWFLFPLEARLRHFHSTAFGTSRSVTWVQEQAGAGGGVGGGDGDHARPRGGARRLGTLKRERVTVRRDRVLADADVLMRHHARHKSVLEVLFTDEEGFGGAVTKEFYNKAAEALQLRSENTATMMWVPDEDGDEGPEHLWQTRGLFPHPLPRGSPESELARRRFRFIGRLVGKALLDGHILPLPLNPAFVRVAILRETLTEEDLPAVYDDRCAGGAVARWLRGAVLDVRRHRECERRVFKVGSSGDCADDEDDASGALRMGLGDEDEAADAAAVDTHLERLSYLSYACPVSRVPLTAEIFEGDADDENDSPATRAARRLARRVDAGEHEVHVGNVEQYLADVVRYWFADGVAAQVEGFREGLSEIFPVDALKAFGAEEITELVCGKDAIEWTREELRRSVLPGFQYTAESPPYLWLIDLLVDMPDDERRGFLEFVAVCPRLPPGGLAALPRGPIRVNRMDPVDKLPEGRTCSQELRLPAYGSKEELARKLRLALQWRNHLGIQ